MMHVKNIMLIMLLAMGIWFATAVAPLNTASAQQVSAGSPPKGELKTTDGKGGVVKCRSYQEAAGGTLLGVIIPCITKTMEVTSIEFSAKLIALLNPLLYSFLTLVIVFFGVRIIQGDAQRLKAEAFFLVLKISIVIGMLQMVPMFLVPAAYETMVESQAIVAGTISTSSMQCQIDTFGDATTPLIWKQMDCLLGKLFGFVSGSGGKPNMLLMSSVFGMLGGFFFGGTFGVTLFLACIGVLWTMFFIVIRSAVTFVNGYMYVCVMLILSPIFMPLILLKVTNPIFEKWWRGILGAMLLPIVVSAYMMFAMVVYDKVLFQPDSLFQTLFNSAEMAKVQKLPQKACSGENLNDPKHRAKNGQTEQDVYGNFPLMQNLSAPTRSGSNDACSAVKVPVLDTEAIAKDLPNQQAVFKKMFNDAMKVLITAWLISEGFKVVINAAQKFVGSISASQISQATSRDEQKLAAAMDGAKQGLYKAYGNESGAEFVKRTATVPENVIKGFMGKIGQD